MFEEKRNDLMMVCVFVGFTKILLRFLVEGLLTTKRAEIIGLSFVFGRASCCHESMSIPLIGKPIVTLNILK